MHKIAFLNGRYGVLSQLGLSPMDRAFLFGDAVYEVFPLYRGRLLDAEAHFRRLERSCSKLRLAVPWTRAVLGLRVREIIRRKPRAFGAGVFTDLPRDDPAPRAEPSRGRVAVSFHFLPPCFFCVS